MTLQTKQGHTALPWRAKPILMAYNHFEITNGEKVIAYGWSQHTIKTTEEEKANIELIITAVNSHYELVEALQEVLEDMTTGKWAGLEHELIGKIKQALTKAGAL